MAPEPMPLRAIRRIRTPLVPRPAERPLGPREASVPLDGRSDFSLGEGSPKDFLSWLFGRPELRFESGSGRICLSIREASSRGARGERALTVHFTAEEPAPGGRLPANLVFERGEVDAFEVGDALRDYLVRFPALDGRVQVRVPALPA